METADGAAGKKRNSPSPTLDGATSAAGGAPAAKRPKVNRACAECKESHTACDTERPCARCVSLGLGDSCRDAECKKRGRPKKVKRNVRGGTNPQGMPSIINGASPPSLRSFSFSFSFFLSLHLLGERCLHDLAERVGVTSSTPIWSRCLRETSVCESQQQPHLLL
jgi:hypothetical protein